MAMGGRKKLAKTKFVEALGRRLTLERGEYHRKKKKTNNNKTEKKNSKS